MSFLIKTALQWTERGLVPDSLIRIGIRRLCAVRLREESKTGTTDEAFAQQMSKGPVAPVPKKANEQHYELSPKFFDLVLGVRRKYSCCLFREETMNLDQAEEEALEETCRSAGIEDGMHILELGCGWGSLSLWIAEKYPRAHITAVSNSAPQRHLIEGEAARLGLHNLQIVTADMNDFSTEDRFDRVVSVEMFEHMRNYDLLLKRISTWIKPGGSLFIHIFCHRQYPYKFETEGADNWLGRHFFTGGIMPSENLPRQFTDHLSVTWQKRWNGTHYEKTANAWLHNLDKNRTEIIKIMKQTYGESESEKWFNRWRVFFMSCAELWGFAGGDEWFVGHYVFEPTSPGQTTPLQGNDSN